MVSLNRAGGDINKKQVVETVQIVKSIVTNIVPDIKIISCGNEEIQITKYLLSLFSPSLATLLNSTDGNTPTLFLPDYSTSSINKIINIINDGFIVSEYLSFEDRLEIIGIGKLLFVENMSLIEDEKSSEEDDITAELKTDETDKYKIQKSDIVNQCVWNSQ